MPRSPVLWKWSCSILRTRIAKFRLTCCAFWLKCSVAAGAWTPARTPAGRRVKWRCWGQNVLKDLNHCSQAKTKCKPKFGFSIDARAKKDLKCILRMVCRFQNFLRPLFERTGNPRLGLHLGLALEQNLVLCCIMSSANGTPTAISADFDAAFARKITCPFDDSDIAHNLFRGFYPKPVKRISLRTWFTIEPNSDLKLSKL